jgi:hypothetical protein|tara:strand:- start:250 stop:468 length:219 start_codon:yes stop_codon:yes gene_type:complete
MANKELTKADMYKKSVLDKMSDKQIMKELLRLKLVDPKKQGFKMGGMAKKYNMGGTAKKKMMGGGYAMKKKK